MEHLRNGEHVAFTEPDYLEAVREKLQLILGTYRRAYRQRAQSLVDELRRWESGA